MQVKALERAKTTRQEIRQTQKYTIHLESPRCTLRCTEVIVKEVDYKLIKSLRIYFKIKMFFPNFL